MTDARKVGRVTIPTDLDVVPETLENILRNELIPQDESEKDKRKLNIPEWLRTRKDGVSE